jgi:hypothetical protein
MEENAASRVTIANTPQPTPSVAEYEPIQVSGVKLRIDSTNNLARDVVGNTSKDEPSHYQGLVPLTTGLSAQQDQPLTYEPLRPQFTEPRAKQHDNVPHTYEPLGIRKSPSDYQSLHAYDNMKNSKRDDNESIIDLNSDLVGL